MPEMVIERAEGRRAAPTAVIMFVPPGARQNPATLWPEGDVGRVGDQESRGALPGEPAG